MSFMEYISPEGLRNDGRRVGELRKTQARMGLFHRTDGSAYLEIGNTKVLAAVYGPREVSQRSHRISDRCFLNCEYSVATFSTGERRKRSKGDKRSNEVSSFLKDTFDQIIMTELFPRTQIDIFVQVIQADGGELAACVNAAMLAVADAGIPVKDVVSACHVGLLSQQAVLDMNYLEECAPGPNLCVSAFSRENQIISLQQTRKMPSDTLSPLLELSLKGCSMMYDFLAQAMQNYLSAARI
eukprot:GCRY01001775.1.p1 GENE.GCRY01001775.1~~GCRY01001775.1.p1  ORF type:complete len:241 (+),score=6.53 GCRY01001775.1:163-885(+)